MACIIIYNIRLARVKACGNLFSEYFGKVENLQTVENLKPPTSPKLPKPSVLPKCSVPSKRLKNHESPSIGPFARPSKETRAAQRRVRLFLSKMNRLEDCAKMYDNFVSLHAHEMPDWEVPVMREHFGNTYRNYIGVHPTQRHELRKRLELAAESESPDIDKIIDNIRETVSVKITDPAKTDNSDADAVFA